MEDTRTNGKTEPFTQYSVNECYTKMKENDVHGQNGKSNPVNGDFENVTLHELPRQNGKTNGQNGHGAPQPLPKLDRLSSMTATVPANVVIPPDGGWGWVVVAASFWCNLVVDGIIYSFAMYLPVLTIAFGESKAKVSLIGSLLSGSYLIAGPFASALANRYGFRCVTIVGAFLASFAFFISYYAESTQFLCVTYGVLGGIGFGFIFVPAVITIGFYFEKWRALATGIAVCGSGIGTFIMAPVSQWLIQKYTWKKALIIQAGIILSCAICGALFRPLQQMSVQVPVPDPELQEKPENEEEDSKKKKLPLLLKSKILKDLKGRSESLLNVYEDLGITVDNSPATTDPKGYFTNNCRYPAASQILQLDVITDDEQSNESNESISKAKNTAAATNNDRLPQLVVLSNRELNTNPHAITTKPREVRERNKSVSPELQKRRNSLMPEMRILLNRKYSLQPNYKSQSFTVSSTTTLASRKSIFNRRHTDIGNRPLYRDDIFFNSSLKRLPQYTSQTSSLNYTMSVTRLPTYTDILEEKEKFSICPEAMRRALATMLDMSLLKSYTFIVLAISGFLTSMGMYTPFMFINDRATTFGIDQAQTTWFLSVLGIANTVGRVGFGVISSIPRMNAVLVNNISLTICGAVTVFSGVESAAYQFFYSSVFGLTIACFSSLRTIIIVDLLGLEKLTNAFGLLLLFQGIAAVIGPPLAGYLQDATGRYDIPFYLSGALIILSAVICYPIEIINNWEEKRKKRLANP